VRTISRLSLLIASSSFVALGVWIAACGGSDGSDAPVTGVDSGGTSSSSGGGDTGVPPTPDAGSPDTGSSSGDAGCTDNTACTTEEGTQGLCRSGACSSCTDSTDDTACGTAYSAVVDGGRAVCAGGQCVAGDCHTNADCIGSKICGLAAANTCASCSSDSQCSTAYGADYVCSVTTGGCETNAAACNVSTDAGACQGNPADICCVPNGAAAGTCAPGNCCSDTQCSGLTPFCVNRTCTGCTAPPAAGPYYVDPARTVGEDALATGASPPATCAFRSITHALAVIGNNAAAGTQVYVKGDVGANETFPIIVPKNVTIKTDPAVVANVHVNVTAGKVGFILATASSGLSRLVIDGQAKTATTGIVVQTGSAATTTLDHVSVTGFLADGIDVRDAAGSTVGGILSIGDGVTSTANGAVGLHVLGHGSATITVPAGHDAAHFDTNAIGIRVVQAGVLTLTGDVGATPPTTGTITTIGNTSAGMVVDQTPGSTVQQNVITGLTSWNTTTGAGMRVFAGSSLKLRSSSLLHNSTNGVHVFAYVDGLTVVDDVSKIDLGASAAADPGKNVLQAPAPNANTNAGVCLQVTKNQGQVLSAYGNTLVTKAAPVASVDCSGPAGGVVSVNGTQCAGGVAVGIAGPANNTNQVITLNCTQQ
jgi:hypothetical protein